MAFASCFCRFEIWLRSAPESAMKFQAILCRPTPGSGLPNRSWKALNIRIGGVTSTACGSNTSSVCGNAGIFPVDVLPLLGIVQVVSPKCAREEKRTYLQTHVACISTTPQIEASTNGLVDSAQC